MISDAPQRPLPPWTRLDSAACLWLTACAALLAWPVLAGGAQSYLDNPVHLAEIRALAQSPSPWVDIGFLGAPLGNLHSPLWTGLLIGAERAGLPLLPAYALLLLAGLAAPALALFAGARLQLSTPGASLAAYVLLVQRPALAGVESPLGGMYPFSLGMALCLALAFALPRLGSSPRSLALVGAGVAVIGLTHTFALLVAGLIGATACLCLAWRRRWRLAAALAGALALGALAAATYWLQPLLDGEAARRLPQNLSALNLLRLLLFPQDLVALVSHRPAADWQLGGTDAAPMGALLLAGLAGAVVQLRSWRGGASTEPTAQLGLGLSAGLVGLLFFVLPGTSLPLLGPVSWRFVYPLRLGLALAALPWLARWPRLAAGPQVHRRSTWGALAVLGAASCLLWGLPLRHQVVAASSPEWTEVEQLWSFLRTRRQPDWGRVYLQNTYATEPLHFDDGAPRLLAHSHALTLSAHATGVRQLGPYYGVTPYATDWTASAHDNLFGVPTRQPRVFAHTLLWMKRTGCSHLVLSNPQLVPGFVSAGMELLGRTGRFAVLQLPRDQWPAAVQGDGASARIDDRQAPVVTVEFEVARAGAKLRLPVAWSPHWQLECAAPVELSTDKMGLAVLRSEVAGKFRLTLRYVQPKAGSAVSAAAWLALAALALLPRRREALGALPGSETSAPS